MNIIRNGGGDTYDMEMYYSANPEGHGQGQGQGVEGRAHTGSDCRATQCFLTLVFPIITSHLITSHYCLYALPNFLHLSPLPHLIIEHTHTLKHTHTATSGSATVSSEGEIGDTPISELLSSDRNRNGVKDRNRERDIGERVGDANVQNSRTIFCTPCAVESEEVIEVEGEGDDADGILESHQIVPVDDRTGALSFNQKGVVICVCVCVCVLH